MLRLTWASCLTPFMVSLESCMTAPKTPARMGLIRGDTARITALVFIKYVRGGDCDNLRCQKTSGACTITALPDRTDLKVSFVEGTLAQKIEPMPIYKFLISLDIIWKINKFNTFFNWQITLEATRYAFSNFFSNRISDTLHTNGWAVSLAWRPRGWRWSSPRGPWRRSRSPAATTTGSQTWTTWNNNVMGLAMHRPHCSAQFSLYSTVYDAGLALCDKIFDHFPQFD